MKLYTSLKEIPANLSNTAVAIGLFDGLHLGHKAVIEEALYQAKQENLTSAVFTFQISEQFRPTDKNANKRIASPSLFMKELEEMGVSVVFAPAFEEVREFSPEAFISEILMDKLHAKFVACGKDFHFGKNATGSAELLKSAGEYRGIKVSTLPLVTLGNTVISSTEIRKRLETGNIEGANNMLGHLYSIDFEVVQGNRIGRTIGAPTINQPYPEEYVIPHFGVYASITIIDGKQYTSVTSVGVKPTIVGNYNPLAETYIQNFSGNLYGRQVEVRLLEFFRDEVKFDTIEALREQIKLDSELATIVGERYLAK